MSESVAFPRTAGRVAFLISLFVGLFLAPTATTAEVVRLDIASRYATPALPEHIRSGPYEVITGIIYLEVDPQDQANELVVDLGLAERNHRGNVEFLTEFELHKPLDANRGNHRLIYFVNNRGRKIGAHHFNDPTGEDWLSAQGYSYLWCGWNCDVIESDPAFNIDVPVVTDNCNTITGKIYAELVSYGEGVTHTQPIVWGGSLAYAPLNMDKSDATLTMRQYRNDAPVEIPRDGWEFARLEDGDIVPDSGTVYIREGFKPGWLYDLMYVGKDPKVTGLGLAAIRDVVSFFRYEEADNTGNENPLAGVIEHAFAWGHSQSARLLNHYVFQNFNGDERGRIVFDGMILNCPGAGKGLFNSRFAQLTRHGSHHEDNLYAIDFFPFATVEQEDPVTGKRDDAFLRARRSGFMPKMMFINSSTDYWTRAASLLHTDVEGKLDLEIDKSVRIYAIAGRAHTDGRIGIVGRALLTALNHWVSFGTEPPESRIPRISDGTLVALEQWKGNWPDIPGVNMPGSFYHPYRLDMGPRWESDGIADNVPPKTGRPYVCLVPQVDEDGNEIAGIRLPEVEVPLATFAGWSMRSPLFPKTLRRNAGRVWPFPTNAEERKKTADPRRSILTRYPTKKDYMFRVMRSLLALKEERLILDEDVDYLLKEAAEHGYWPVSDEEVLVYIKEFSAQPSRLNRGNIVRFTVVTEGKLEDVFSFRIVWREAPHVRVELDEDDRDEAETAADNVKTFTMEIGQGFPQGTFHFDIQALDRNLNPVYLAGTLKGGKGELGSVTLVVD